MTDRLESTTAMSVFKCTQVFLCYQQSFDTLGARDFSCAVSGFGQVSQRSMIFLKIQVTRIAMIIWLRVKVNGTRLCTAVHFARNKIKYQKSRENELFQYKLYAFTIACLSFTSLYKGSFTNVTARCPLHKNRRKAKNYHSQYL